MSLIDLTIVILVAPIALIGYRRGFAVSAMISVAFAAGAFTGARLAHALLEEESGTTYVPLVSMAGGFVLGVTAAVVAGEMAAAAHEREAWQRHLRLLRAGNS